MGDIGDIISYIISLFITHPIGFIVIGFIIFILFKGGGFKSKGNGPTGGGSNPAS